MIDGLLMEHIFTLAKKIFEDYTENRINEGKTVEYTEWDDLPDDLKYSNIRQAENISVKLDLIDCYIAVKDDPNPEIERFSEEESNTLAMKEHELWVDERESTGWVYGEEKNIEEKRSPYLRPWDEIPDDIKKYDIEATDNIIPLLHSVGLKVCHKQISRSDCKIIKKYFEDRLPIMISVTGHRSISSDQIAGIKERFTNVIDRLLEQYPNTDIIVMSALAEGADSIIADAALEICRPPTKNQVYLAPVLPMSIEKYAETFDEKNRSRILSEVKHRLDDDRALSPCILCDDSVNRVTAFRRLSAYLVANSHIIVGVWDGTDNGKRGGTSDTLRMAYGSIDNDLLNSISPMSLVTKNDNTSVNRFINGSCGPAIYWISANIKKDDPNTGSNGFIIPPNDTEKRYYREGNRRLKQFDDTTHDDHRRSRSESRTISLERPLYLGDKRISSLSVGLPIEHHLAFSKIDGLNKDIVRYREKKKGTDTKKDNGSVQQDIADEYPLVSGNSVSESCVRSNGCLKEMSDRFRIIDGLSRRYQKKSEYTIKLLISLSTISGLLFSLLLLFGGSLLLTATYSVVYMVTLVLSFLHTRFKEHSKHISYRCLADTMRVQFYWALSEVNDSVSMCCYNYRNEDMFWLSGSLKSFGSFFLNDYGSVSDVPIQTRISCTKESWVAGQRRTIDKEDDKSQKNNYFSTIISMFFANINLLLSIIVVIVGLLLVEQATATIYHIRIIDSDLTNSIVLKIMMVVCTSISSAILWKQSISTMRSNAQAHADHILLGSIIEKLESVDTTSFHRNIERKQSILHEYGVRVVDENCDWLIESAKKDYKKKANGIRSGGDHSDKSDDT